MSSEFSTDDMPRQDEPTSFTPVRWHYMDNLRALALMTGVFFHAAIAYGPLLSGVWLTADKDTSAVFDIAAWFLHLFRIPLFFLIAGFFTVYLAEKRGLRGLLKNRAIRILAPFVLFLPIIWISFALIVGWALEAVENPSPILEVIAGFAALPDPPPSPVTTTHLWFLYNLCQFYIVYALLCRFNASSGRWVELLSSPKFLTFVLPLFMVPALASQYAPHPAPEQFLPQLWSFGFFGIFFLVGTQLFKRPQLIDELRPYSAWLLLTSVGLYAILYRFFPEPFTFEEMMAVIESSGPEFSGRQLLIAALEAYISVHMTIVCLVAGKIFLDQPSRTNRFIADSSYWIYIMHLPLLFLIQFYLLDTSWNPWVKFLVSSFGTLAIGAITYVLLVRWTPIGWLLNGRKKKPQPDAA